ncbi:hypothetical protein CR513_22146, partial [Mucuna pruriens]
MGRHEGMFLEKFFPVSRTTTIRKEICGIRQHTGETLHEYWERFNKLCATCSYHQISEQLLIQYFYEGLIIMDRRMINATSGGALMDKTPVAARNLISNMASNTQQFGTRGAATSRAVNEVATINNHRLENKITEPTSLVRQLGIGQHYTSPSAKVCGICTSTKHPTNACPTFNMEDNSVVVNNMIGNNMVVSSTNRPKGSTQTRDSVLHKIHLRTRIDTNNQFPNIKHHPSDNNHNNQFSNITIHLFWKIW